MLATDVGARSLPVIRAGVECSMLPPSPVADAVHLARSPETRAGRRASLHGRYYIADLLRVRFNFREARLAQSGLYENLAPPNAASYIKPPLMMENGATPFW